MQQLKNFLSKREQSQARLSFAKREKSRLKAKIMMTLVLLMTAAAGAWAQTGENIFQYCYDCQRNPAYPKTTTSATLSDFTNPLVGYKGSGFGMDNTSAGPWKLEYVGLWSTTDNHGIEDFRVSNYQSTYNCTDVPVFRLYQWNATANEYQHASYGVVCAYAKVTNAVEHTAFFEAADGWGCVLTNSSHSSSMDITFDEDLTTGLTTLIAAATPNASGTPVDLTRGTGDKINEWTLTNGMPAGNVLVNVAYKDRATMALTYGGTAITTEANAVTAFKGFEQEFAEALTAAVQNIEPTFNSGTAQDVTTTLAADFTFKSSDANIIGFKSGETYADEGTLDQMEFREVTTSPVTLTVTYKGTDDLESKSQALLVTIEKKTYTVSLADNTEDADSWKGNVNDAETDVNLPITKLEGGEKVTLKYNGRLKVKSVTATIAPAAAPSAPDGAINGKFSVSATKQVYFSKGNLRYASGAWSFFDNQYDYYTSYSADAWNHFGWSTFVTNYGMKTSTTNGDYYGDFMDWGSNSDLQTALGTGWFTLTSDEWTYLFNTRESGSTVFGTENARYTQATINTDGTGVNGVILFPDGVTIANTEVSTAGTVNGASAWGTKCTNAQWTALESKGCVFLPAAVWRYGNQMVYAISSGRYWSGTASDGSYAYCVSFSSGSLSPAANEGRCRGFSVRLVREVTE